MGIMLWTKESKWACGGRQGGAKPRVQLLSPVESLPLSGVVPLPQRSERLAKHALQMILLLHALLAGVYTPRTTGWPGNQRSAAILSKTSV